MSYDFKNKITPNELRTAMSLVSNDPSLTTEDRDRLNKVYERWNFYEGYHWEGIDNLGETPEITENYCRPFVNKFVAFEFGTGINIKLPIEDNMEDTTVGNFLNEIWDDNNKDILCVEMGQTKAVTGMGCIQVSFEKPEDIDDPFGEYPKGRIRLTSVSNHVVFPQFDSHDKDKLISLTIAYPIDVEETTPILRKVNIRQKLYKQIWTKDYVIIEDGTNEPYQIPNTYGFIPFVLVPNYPVAGKNYTQAQSDLEDLIPLNVELNSKTSDISEIIDYHASPVTVIYGAKLSTLEKGANKVWGGLPTDARVQNLELQSDLSASNNYRNDIKSSMHEIGAIPEGALGGKQAISNTSSVALTIANSPIIERTRIKRMYTKKAIQKVNKMILKIALDKGIIEKPEDMSNKDFYKTDVIFPDVLPKDRLLELQQIQLELKSGLEYRRKAMERLGKTDLTDYLNSIEEDYAKHPEFYGQQKNDFYSQNNEGNDDPQLNSGFANGQTPQEEIKKTTNGQNAQN